MEIYSLDEIKIVVNKIVSVVLKQVPTMPSARKRKRKISNFSWFNAFILICIFIRLAFSVSSRGDGVLNLKCNAKQTKIAKIYYIEYAYIYTFGVDKSILKCACMCMFNNNEM